jgi:glutamate dehydrogenase/leucine dehydrogenase
VKRLGHDLRDRRVVMQGFGNVGSVVARGLEREGCLVVGVGDIDGAVWNSRGLDVDALADHVSEAGTVVGVSDADALGNAALLEQGEHRRGGGQRTDDP